MYYCVTLCVDRCDSHAPRDAGGCQQREQETAAHTEGASCSAELFTDGNSLRVSLKIAEEGHLLYCRLYLKTASKDEPCTTDSLDSYLIRPRPPLNEEFCHV